MNILRNAFFLLGIMVLMQSSSAGDLSFSDPARTPPPPRGSAGFADRSPNLDALPGFRQPPEGYGVVPFFWWLGDPLTRERLEWILRQMDGLGISGYQINYAHSDRGGRSYGLTYPSEPALFSEPWWDLAGWFLRAARRQGASISLSDYTLGFGQGWCVDELLREHPELTGYKLIQDADGRIRAEAVPWSLNPLHPASGRLYAENFFGRFERRFPGESGRGLNFFFSDELQFGVGGRWWSTDFAAEFQRRKGYDLTPELPALFREYGPRTPKIRMDYSDVMVALAEEGYFKPVFDWHQQRGMIMGCDHGGRGTNVTEFGDYFRTQRWMQGPGSDQPGLGRNLIKAKVAASIAHLYQRPRVWLEGFYGSGWGTTSAELTDATLANYVMGYNLLSLHGMYYSTHGGWWEWAPPDNTFRMPYWRHMCGFMDMVRRLSYLLSQGVHRCDVAILYPVASVEAGMDGAAAVKTAFAAAQSLYAQSIDFDFLDFESLARSVVSGRSLQVSGESYRVLVLPAMKAVRHSTLEKALEFQRAGGKVVALGALPEASDRLGRDDPEVIRMVRELFPRGAEPEVAIPEADRDYRGPGYIQHRLIGPLALYAVYGVPQGAECFFRASGQVELWDPWTGDVRPLAATSQADGGTWLRMPLTEKEIQLIVFRPGRPLVSAAGKEEYAGQIRVDGEWEFELQPTADNRFGDFHWPPTPGRIGAEVRELWYSEKEPEENSWRRVTCTFGPQFLQSDASPAGPEAKPYEFSWRWGRQEDPGHQGYHGLKGEVHDEFLTIGRPKRMARHMPDPVKYEADGSQTFFSTAVLAPRKMTGYALTGAVKPMRILLNGKPADGNTLDLREGANTLELQYDQPGRTYFVVSAAATVEPLPAGAMAMRWWNHPAVLPFDIRSGEERPVGWYRFLAPPGLQSMRIRARGRVQAWAAGQPLADQGEGRFRLGAPAAGPVEVRLRIEPQRGFYGGAALAEPILLECGPGRIEPGDWSLLDGLRSYSGGAWYRKTVRLPACRKAVLNLGQVASTAEVRVNGKPAGTRVAPPWTFDISRLVRPGSNRIEVLVYSALAGHYSTIPTAYRGSSESGLLGPVSLQFQTR